MLGLISFCAFRVNVPASTVDSGETILESLTVNHSGGAVTLTSHACCLFTDSKFKVTSGGMLSMPSFTKIAQFLFV
jgi:hypothetical protein